MENRRIFFISALVGVVVLVFLSVYFFSSDSDVLTFRIENVSDRVLQDIEVTVITPDDVYAHDAQPGSVGPGADFAFTIELSSPSRVRVSGLLGDVGVQFEDDIYREGLPRFFSSNFVTLSGDEAGVLFSVAPSQ